MRAAFAGMVDYAGLFPPAACSLDDAVRHYAQYRGSAERWMLGRFVVPAAQLARLKEAAALLVDETDAWPLAVTIGADVSADLTAVEQFHVPGLAIDAIECKVASMLELEVFEGRALAIPNSFFELAVDDAAAEMVDRIGSSSGMGKVRTGGLTAEAFPAAPDVIRLVAAFLGAGVAFKATAGLHHPITGDYPISYAADAPRQRMFGFVNLLVAVTALLERGDPARATAILEERDRRAIVMAPDGITWKDDHYDLEVLERAHREGFTCFGSCSFREPFDELGLGATA
jgi:hypothetical protein